MIFGEDVLYMSSIKGSRSRARLTYTCSGSDARARASRLTFTRMESTMNHAWLGCAVSLGIGLVTALSAQQPQRPVEKKPFQAQSASTVAFSVKDNQEIVEITNVDYQLTGNGIPGRPRDERLMLRYTSHTKEAVDEVGMEASTTIQAWPLGVDLKQKPVYTLTVPGVEPKTVNNEVLLISRGLEEVEWWSVYKLGSSAHLFDTYAPLLQFSVGLESQEMRYVGLEVPGDDVSDARLKAPNVVAVLTYSSGERVIREALVTCDKRELAQLLRSFADSTRKVTLVENRLPSSPGKKTGELVQNISVSMGPSYPSPPAEYTISIPIAKDDLDLTHVTASSGLHAAVWKR